MLPHAAFVRFQRALSSILSATRSQEDAKRDLHDLLTLDPSDERVPSVKERLCAAEEAVEAAYAAWDRTIDEVNRDWPSLSGMLPPDTKDPSFHPEAIHLRVA